MSDEITPKPLLKKPEIKLDPEGRFERHGKTISKVQKKKKPTQDSLANLLKSVQERQINKQPILDAGNTPAIGSGRRGPGRPKGSQNKTTLALKEAILAAADEAGGQAGLVGYLKTLAIENSSAFAGLLGKVLPTTLAASDSDGGPAKFTFERVIVWPDGRREIECVTPRALPAPDGDKDQ